jgi:hypothetical protein
MYRIFSNITLSILVGLSALAHAEQPIEKKSTIYKYLVIGGVVTGLASLAYWHRQALTDIAQSGAKKAQELLPTQETVNAKLDNLHKALPTKESISKALLSIKSYMPTLPTKEQLTASTKSLASYLPSQEIVASKFAALYKRILEAKTSIFDRSALKTVKNW